jgi:hypothetical protein
MFRLDRLALGSQPWFATLLLGIGSVAVCWSGVAHAAEPGAPSQSGAHVVAPAPSGSPAASPAARVRRDAQGLRGVSPLIEALNVGDRAFLAQDFESALRAYQDVIKLDPHEATGYLRLATALRALDERLRSAAAATGSPLATSHQAVFDALDSALRFATDPGTRAAVLMCRAETFERAGQFARALAEWNAYLQAAANFTSAAQADAANPRPPAKGAVYLETAEERARQIAAEAVRQEQYRAVRERIQKREAELGPTGLGRIAPATKLVAH